MFNTSLKTVKMTKNNQGPHTHCALWVLCALWITVPLVRGERDGWSPAERGEHRGSSLCWVTASSSSSYGCGESERRTWTRPLRQPQRHTGRTRSNQQLWIKPIHILLFIVACECVQSTVACGSSLISVVIVLKCILLEYIYIYNLHSIT